MPLDSFLKDLPEGKILVEYVPTKHPERIFHEMMTFYLNSGDVPLVVDVIDTLHVFNQHLAFQKISLPLEKIPVIKCGGRMDLGNVLGKVSITDNFEYYLAQHTRIARKFLEKIKDRRQVVFFLGMGKFITTFQDDPYKLEEYFEMVYRGYGMVKNRINIFFVNRDIVNGYALKSLEQDSHYVLVVSDEVRLVKAPGRVEDEAL